MRHDRVGMAADDRTSQIGKSIEVSRPRSALTRDPDEAAVLADVDPNAPRCSIVAPQRGCIGPDERLLPERPTPERFVEAYYLQRTRFESIAERKLRRRQLTEDGNVEISGRDLR